MRIKICNDGGQFKKPLIYLGFILTLIISVIGVSYAAFLFIGTGTKENSITTGQIVVKFDQTSQITINNRFPEPDAEGIANTDPKSISTFTVSSDIVGDVSLNYAIGLTSITEGTTLKSDYIKIYMTKNGSVAPGFTEGKGKTVKSFEASTIEGYFDSHAIATGTLTGTQVDTYTIKAWIDERYVLPLNQTNNGVVHNITTISETYSFKIKVVAIEGELNVEKTSIPNAPELATNMIPVYYDATNEVWKKADKNNSNESYKWYDYDNKMWANAVTVTDTNRNTYLNAEAGTAIQMEDINTMWVWIPRFEATGDYATYNGTNDINNPGAFDITFVNNSSTTAHGAFTFGTQALNGFWMGKFETSHTTLASNSETKNNLECSNNTCSNANGLIIKPNAESLRRNNVSNFFYGILSMKQNNNSFGFDSSVDTHMIKNNEWGAVAYLTQSIYGRCSNSTSCTKIGINNKTGLITGYGAPAGSSKDINSGSYETSSGMNASTTGNIYGVYDMSGGATEYVMGVYTDGTRQWSGNDLITNSGFTGCVGKDCSNTYSGVPYPNSKYYNSYTNTGNESLPVTNYSNSMQHALTETKGWYGNSALFVIGNYPWFVRGGYYINGSYAGVFDYGDVNGRNSIDGGSRAILVK